MLEPRERIDCIAMQAFRGVPAELEIHLDGKSTVIFGENGTGKSTVADAVEWYATGRVEHLNREGRSDGLRHQGASPESPTCVVLETDGDFSGTRHEGDRARRTSERLLLRGRTLAEFVEKTKTEKWEYLVPILGMGEIERLRSELQRATTELNNALKLRRQAVMKAWAHVEVLGVEPGEQAVLTALQKRAGEAGLTVPESVEAVRHGTWQPTGVPATPEQQRWLDVRRLIDDIESAEAVAPGDPRLARWNEHCSQVDRRAAAYLALVQAADRYLSSGAPVDHCPVCKNRVDGTELAASIRRLMEELRQQHVSDQRARAELDEVIEEEARSARDRATHRRRAKRLGVSLPPVPPSAVEALRSAREALKPLPAAQIAAYQTTVNRWKDRARMALRTVVPGRVEEHERLVIELTALYVYVRLWLVARAEEKAAEFAHGLAKRVFDAYDERQRTYVSSVLHWISGSVAELYQQLQPGLAVGTVLLEQHATRGVEFSIEFHGSEQRPPQGVLSESFLNSLAIAVFLAMALVFNRLGFLVLDDVVNSFDVAHRRRLVDLLVTRFQDWQVIVLTHDRIFYDQLRRQANGWKIMEIVECPYDTGPRLLNQQAKTMLEDAQARLDQGDVQGAAGKARHALEEVLREACEGLEAPLPFRQGRANDIRDAGQLLKGLRSQLKAIGADPNPKQFFNGLETDIQTALNVEVHANGDHASRSEVGAAIQRITELDAYWRCHDCGTTAWKKGKPTQSSTCNCGQRRLPKQAP